MTRSRPNRRPGPRALLGIEPAPAGHREQLISAAGGFAGILLVWAATACLAGPPAAAGAVMASVGASAVLLFAAPHGPMSQPWPVLGGHALSAAVGVACHRLLPDPRLAAPAAVGLAIGVMYYARCLHPPGGATALAAVLGGPAVHALGYRYVLAPVLLDAGVVLAAGVLVNAPFPRRRYPAALARR
ncbi:MAG: hypothetical protein JWO31_2891, partial [Phycisphaerales bacterium]|nr:hypothetical protein [Phycisphaerales bacterium]